METMSGFQKFFMFMGPWKWPLLLLASIVLILIIIKTIDLLIKKNGNTRYLNAILFWGCITALIGIIGQMSALWMSITEIMKAPDISLLLVYTGFLSSFVTVLFGFIVLLVAAICWWGLRNYKGLISGN